MPANFGPVSQDFYLHERALASYFEKDWADHIFKTNRCKFEYAPFDPGILCSKYHEQFAEFLQLRLQAHSAKPERLLEVGSSLGRTYFELCRRIPSLRSATLLEPSGLLLGGFQKIFASLTPEDFELLQGNSSTQTIRWDTSSVRAVCANVQLELLNQDFQRTQLPTQSYDLVVCSNVIDQCQEPRVLVKLLQQATRVGGHLILSCTYQWQDKYLGNASEPIRNINDLFASDGWQSCGETNLPFQVRVYERHWKSFLSHLAIFQRIG